MALVEGAGLTPEPEEHLADGVTHELSDDGTANEYYVPGTCDARCLSPLHTHDPTGLIHTESRDPDQEPYTLGQFFTEWGVRLDNDCVGEFCKADTPIVIYLNGDKHAGNPAEIELNSHLEIAIVIGTAPSAIPDNYTFFDPE